MTPTTTRRERQRRHRRRRLRRVATSLATVLVVLVVSSVLLVGAGRLTGTFDVAVVLSGSMEPAMRPADLVVLVDRDPAQVAVGDVLAFTPPRRFDDAGGRDASPLTLHRIIGIEAGEDGGPHARTQGDANASVDPWLLPLDGAAEVAEVTRRVPLLGHAVLWAQGRTGRIALYSIAVLLLASPVLGWVRRQWRQGSPPADSDAAGPPFAASADVPTAASTARAAPPTASGPSPAGGDPDAALFPSPSDVQVVAPRGGHLHPPNARSADVASQPPRAH